jgi:tetratricopeptide (TPR) repeat protein
MSHDHSGGREAGDGDSRARQESRGVHTAPAPLESYAADDTMAVEVAPGLQTQAEDPEVAFLRTEASVSASPIQISLPRRFELRRSLGAGGMGEVVLAHDNVLGRDVAIKVLRTSDAGDVATRNRLLHEAQAAAQIHHPHIVSIHDVDLDAGLIVMEYLPNGSGRTLLERRGRLPLKELLPIARSLCLALQAAHEAGLVHRDIKPDNVLFDQDGTVKVADFGVAQYRRKTTSGGSEIVGTPAYMAPEQLRGADPDPRADIYALGLTLYELAAGRRFHRPEGPADRSPRGLARAVGSRALARILARCLAEDPHQRWASASDLERALAGLQRRHQQLRLGLLLAAVVVATALPVTLLLPRSSEAPAVLLRVAVIPFANQSGQASLDWLRQGFANLLSSGLRRRGVPTIRHEQMRDAAANSTDPRTWEEAARAAGASDLLTGKFVRSGGDLLVTAALRGNTYQARGQAARADSLAEELAHLVARDLVGEAETPKRGGRSPEAIRLYEMGNAALQQHEFHKAEELLREAIRLDPDYVSARYALITARLARPRRSLATLVADIDDALSRPLKPHQRELFEALRLRVLRRYGEAAARYDRLVSQFPEEKEAYYGLAVSLFHLGRGEQAMAAFKRLVKLAPAYHLAYRHPIEYLGTRGRAKDLSALLYQLRRASPPASFLALMELRLEVARRQYQRALARGKSVAQPQPELLAAMGGVHAILGDTEVARELYVQASALAPESWEFRLNRAALDLLQGRLADFHGDGAWEAGDAAEVEQTTRRLSVRGLLYAMLGRKEEARRDLDNVHAVAGVQLRRQLSDYILLESLCGWVRRDPEPLERLAAQIQGMSPTELAVLPAEIQPFLSAAIAAASGKTGAALKKLREGYRVRESPLYAPVFLIAIARAALAEGERTAAGSACEDVLSPPALSPYRAAAVPPCLGILAQVREEQGRREEAKRYAQSLLQSWRDSAAEIPEMAQARAISGKR